MVSDGLQLFQKLKIAGKWDISSQRVAGPYYEKISTRVLVG